MPSLSPLSSPLSQYKYFHSVSFHVLKAVVTLYFLTSVRREERLHGGEHFYELYIICSLISPYRQLYNTDNSVKRRLGSVPLVSVLKRFDCIYLITLILIGNQIDRSYD